MNKISTLLLAVFIATAFTACEDDDCDQLHIDTGMMSIPSVLKGSFPVGTQTVDLGDSLTFAPQLLDTTGVTYTWNVDGQDVSTDSAYTFRVDKPCRAKLVCTLQNAKGKAVLESDIFSRHNLSEGLIVVKAGSLDFYNPTTGMLYPDVFASLNFGIGLNTRSYDKIQAIPLNGKLYIIKSTSTSNVDHLYVADAATLYKETSLTVEANLGSFVPLDNRYALIDNNGWIRMDLATMQKTVLFKDRNWSVYNSMVFGKNLLVNTTYKDITEVGCFEVNDLLAARENNRPTMKSLDIQQNGKFNFVTGNDGCAYTIGYDTGTTSYYLAKIASDLSVTKIPLPFEPARPQYASNNTFGITAAIGEDAIYIVAANQLVYKYTPGNPASLNRPFIASAPEDSEICSGICVNPLTGEIYVPYSQEPEWDEYTGKIIIYNTSGAVIKTIDCGDGIIRTILFNNK